jgi:hypothetical protein
MTPDSASNLAAAATAAGWDPAFRLVVASGFAASATPDGAVRAAEAAGQFAAAAGLPVDLLADALAAAYDRRGHGAAFAAYLTAMVAATAPAVAPAAQGVAISWDAATGARVAALMALEGPLDGVAVGEVLFSRQSTAGDVTAVFDVVNGDDGPTAEVYLRRGMSMLGATPPHRPIASPYRLHVGDSPFTVVVG